MSFENKGFPNSLNKRYDSLRARALNYDEAENFGFNPTQLSNLSNIVKTDNRLDTEKNKQKTTAKRVKTTKAKKTKKDFKDTFLGGLISDIFKGGKDTGTDDESRGIVEGGGLSTRENPANLPEFVVESKRPQSNKMKYFYYIIAVILIILIYKQFKK